MLPERKVSMRKRKQILTGCLLLLCVASLIPSQTAGAATETIQKTSYYDITAQGKEEAMAAAEGKSDFPEQTAEDSAVYVRQEITAKVVTEEPETQAETVYQTKKSGVILSGETFEPEQTMQQDGITYTLVQTTKKKKTLVKEKKETVTAYTVYQSKKAAKAAPASKQVKVSGSDKKVTCYKTGAVVRQASVWKDSYIDITFVSYDADHYIWNGITVEKDTKTPLAGYERELIKSVGLTPSTCKVKSISYSGKAYRNENGVLCRKARAKVRKKVKQYRANYKGVKKTKAVTGTVYTLLYAGRKEVETGKTVYGVTVTAAYARQKTHISVAVLTVGILLALVFLSGVLLLLAKKKRKPKRVVLDPEEQFCRMVSGRNGTGP